MSPRTVEDVLSRVYAKLDIQSRAELGAWIASQEKRTVTLSNDQPLIP